MQKNTTKANLTLNSNRTRMKKKKKKSVKRKNKKDSKTNTFVYNIFNYYSLDNQKYWLLNALIRNNAWDTFESLFY